MTTQHTTTTTGMTGLKHIGIDTRFIEQNAGALNTEFERIYNNYPVNQRLSQNIATAPTNTPTQTSAQPQTAPNNHEEVKSFVKQQSDKVEAQLLESMQDLANQFSSFAKQIEKRIASLETQPTQTTVQTPQQQSAPQVEPKVTTAQTTSSEHQQLRETVAIDKIFNFSGKGR